MSTPKNTGVTPDNPAEKFPVEQIETGHQSPTNEAIRCALIEGEQSGIADYSLQGIIDELAREE